MDLTTAIMQGNAQVVFLMKQMLAIAADTNETTWLKRLSELGPEGLDAEYAARGIRPEKANREMAALYSDTAKKLLADWVDMRAALLAFDEQTIAPDEGESEDMEETEINVQFDIPASEMPANTADLNETANNIENVMSALSGIMESGSELYEATEDSDIPSIYGMLKELPYGDGTLYDFFTLDYAQVSGENISAMYPLVSTLTSGQIAAIDLLPLRFLLQIGSTSGEAFAQFDPENSNMVTGIDIVGAVSIYLDVNRELFSDKTALTSEALREGLDKENGWMKPDPDLLGLSRLTTLSWAVTGFFGAMTAVSLIQCAVLPGQLARATEQLTAVRSYIQQFYNRVDDYIDDIYDLSEFALISVDKTARPGFTKVTFTLDRTAMGDDGIRYVTDTEVMEKYFDSSYNIKHDYDTIDEFKHQFENTEAGKTRALDRWGTMKVAFGVVFALLTAISIGLSVYDLYRYYNVDYTPIPKYIVDEAEITTLDADGNRFVTRNDAAYYIVAPTNREKTHEQFTALQDYADLNGDAGKEWLALYYAKKSGSEPILADSLTVVTGSTSMPDGYTRGIHLFGSNAAANLTDSRFTYNDDLGGLYCYFKTEAAASSDTASAFSRGTFAMVGISGLVAGAIIGAAATLLIKRRKTAAAA